MIVREGGKLKLMVPELNCEEVRDRITALTGLMKAAKLDQVNEYDYQLVLAMIEDYMPGDEMLEA